MANAQQTHTQYAPTEKSDYSAISKHLWEA